METAELPMLLSITHKVHLMFKHVEWQMEHVPGGLGDKMEDWIELAHQAGARLRARFRTVKDPLVRAVTRAKASFRVRPRGYCS